MDNVNKYVFISGTGRSGTNITKDVLSDHPDVFALPFEYRFTIDPDGLISTYNILKNVWSPFQADLAITRLESLLMGMGSKSTDITEGTNHQTPYSDWELGKWFPNYYQQVKQLISELSVFSYSGTWPGVTKSPTGNNIRSTSYAATDTRLKSIFNAFLVNLYDNILEEKNASCFVEDNTWSLLFAKDIYDILPRIKFIHVVRDPRDVVASMLHQRWCPSDLSQCIQFFKSIHSRISNQIEEIPCENLYMFSIEDFVKKTEIIQNVADFIGIDPNMVDQNKLSNSSFGRWQKQFSQSESKMLNMELKKEIIKFNTL